MVAKSRKSVVRQSSSTDKSGITEKEKSNTLLAEVAWEVCNQVGGIYTVIKSKAPSTDRKWGENYFLIGPYFAEQASTIFEPSSDYSGPVGQAVLKMREYGFEVHYGTWLVEGRPRVVLLNPESMLHKAGEYRFLVWDHHHISLPDNDPLINQVVTFGFQVVEFFKILAGNKGSYKNIIAHFHEWMSGVPIPELRREGLGIKIVFTTHATMLGRYLAMNDNKFYDNLPTYNWEEEAAHFNISPIVHIERAAAHGAHIFSTVSDITGKECTHLLGRTPDVILPNGLNITRFEVLHELQNLHRMYKEKIHEFVMGHFFHNQSFDLDKTLYFFTSGRFEFFNKGYDLTLEALARLNWKMKEHNIDRTVVAFFITKNPYRSINSSVLESRALLEEIRRNCDQIQETVTNRMFHNMVSTVDNSDLPNLNDLVDDYMALRLRKNMKTWRGKQMPAIVTHDLVDEAKDPIMNFMKTAGLLNYAEDKVKVVYHPDFISSDNSLFRMEYYQFVRGCHMGLFPSYYEPWGYTPLECMASGVPSVTTDFSGFGSYIEKNVDKHEDKGIYLIKRNNRSMDEAAEELANKMFEFVQLDRRKRIDFRNRVEAASTLFAWRELGIYYDKAYSKVLGLEG